MPMSFHPVEENLRESFRLLADGRERSDVAEFPGLSLASLGVAFQMFNGAFLNAPVETRGALVSLVERAKRHFEFRRMGWSLWVCEDWIEKSVRRQLSRVCADAGLRLVSDLPGMAAQVVVDGRPQPRDLEIVEVESAAAMLDFRLVGSACFRVPPLWFAEVFRDEVWRQGRFRSFVGYRKGEPVATSALVFANQTAGIYNVATLPEHRGRGFAEAMTRFAVQAASSTGDRPESVILQSTAQGYRMYQKMGFRDVTRILVYAS